MKMLLFHHSDYLVKVQKPLSDRRPLFYWYADRFCTHLGYSKYMYFFLIDPKKDNIALRSRTESQDFSDLHKAALEYKAFKEGKLPNAEYREGGIAMSFSPMTPTLILEALEPDQYTKYKVIFPRKRFKRPHISLFDENKQPIPFDQIPVLKQLLPDLSDSHPFLPLQVFEDGTYRYHEWNPMITEKSGLWL